MYSAQLFKVSFSSQLYNKENKEKMYTNRNAVRHNLNIKLIN